MLKYDSQTRKKDNILVIIVVSNIIYKYYHISVTYLKI